MGFYDRTEELLQEKGLSKRQLAMKAGIPYQTIISAFRRKSEGLSLEYKKKIAEALEVNLFELYLMKDGGDSMTFAERLRAFRKEAHLTQRELGEKSGLAVINISQYERDIYTPKPEVGRKIAVALGVSVSDLYGWDEESEAITTGNNTLYDRIEYLLKQKNMTKKALAVQAGIPYTTLMSAFNRGKGSMSADYLNQIAKVLEVSLPDLMNWDECRTNGEWINQCCSVCGISKYNFFTVTDSNSRPFGTWKYCPNCGTKMKDGE